MLTVPTVMILASAIISVAIGVVVPALAACLIQVAGGVPAIVGAAAGAGAAIEGTAFVVAAIEGTVVAGEAIEGTVT